LNKKQYYDRYIKNDNEGICVVCGKPTTFRGTRYLITCSTKCKVLNPAFRDAISTQNKGRKQSKETIEKRIKNTDQINKDKKRLKTLKDRYGSYSTIDGMSREEKQIRSQKLSLALSNRKHTYEHHKKVIDSKRRNGTLNHKQSVKDKIRESLLKVYASDNPPNPIGKSNGRGHNTGHVEGIFYRSSYEEIFLLTCSKFNISVISAETTEFRMKYFVNQKQHFYYPDFYLPDYNCIVEIKPISRLTDSFFEEKLNEALTTCEYEYLLLTEEELFDESFEWVKNLEYLLS